MFPLVSYSMENGCSVINIFLDAMWMIQNLAESLGSLTRCLVNFRCAVYACFAIVSLSTRTLAFQLKQRSVSDHNTKSTVLLTTP